MPSTSGGPPGSQPDPIDREVSGPGAPPGGGSGAPDPDRLVRAGLIFYGAMALTAIVWRMGFYSEPIWLTSPPPEVLLHGRDFTIGAGVGLAIVAFSYIATESTAWGERLARSLAEPLASLSVPNAVLLALASGLAEEMLFRGALQPRVGWVTASVLFGVVHFVPRRELLPWTAFAVAVGFGFGWLFDVTGSLTAPVVAHTVVNGVNLPLLVRRYGDTGVRSS